MLFPVNRRHRTSRAARGIAFLCVLLMVASNALAAMGLCAAKTPVASAVSLAVSDEAPCAQHVDEGAARTSSEPSARIHCPQDDPGAQLRTGDIPAAALMAAIATPLRIAVVDGGDRGCAVGACDAAPATPLYARLSRLLL